MRSTLRRGVMVAMGAAAVLSLGLGSAQADPSFVPDADDLVGTGSDTTQFVTDSLADAYDPAPGTARLASFDAVNPQTGLPGDQIEIRPGVFVARPNGSSAGIRELTNNTDVDFARSSRPSNGTTAEDALSFIPFALDGLSYVVDDTTSVPTNLTAADLRDVYTCALPGFNAKLPQDGSGTRTFFLAQIGVSESEIDDAVAAGCVDDTVQEHDASAVDGDEFALAPFSEARFRENPPNPTNPPSASIDLASDLDSGAFYVTREVYHVVRDTEVNDAAIQAVFGPGGYLCTELADGEQGFLALDSGCGVPDGDV
ncbi:substrate-binding domain-containing protein [Actinophytocola sediminis]